MLIKDIFYFFCLKLSLGCSQMPPADEAEIAQQAYLTSLNTPILHEASGITASAQWPGQYWLHNDSGNAAELYRWNPQTDQVEQTIKLDGVKLRDWEDIASYSHNGKHWLVVGDIGDNHSMKSKVRLHLLQEPSNNAAVVSAQPVRTITLRYEDGPRDAEGLAVSPEGKTLWIVSKRNQPPRLYQAPLNQGDEVVARFVTELVAMPQPTPSDTEEDPWYGDRRWQISAMDISRDGKKLLLTSYKDSYIYNIAVNNPEWWRVMAHKPGVIDTAQMMQTEAGCFDLSGKAIWVASEQLPTQLFYSPLP